MAAGGPESSASAATASLSVRSAADLGGNQKILSRSLLSPIPIGCSFQKISRASNRPETLLLARSPSRPLLPMARRRNQGRRRRSLKGIDQPAPPPGQRATGGPLERLTSGNRQPAPPGRHISRFSLVCFSSVRSHVDDDCSLGAERGNRCLS